MLCLLVSAVNVMTWFPFTGVDDNETIRVFGSGGADPDGNQPGDLYVTIKVTCMSLILHDALASFFFSFFPS